MMNPKRIVTRNTTAGMTGTHNIIAKTDKKIVETETIETGTDPILPMKKENVTPTLKTLPPGVGVQSPPPNQITSQNLELHLTIPM